jgi:hypothetical protein
MTLKECLAAARAEKLVALAGTASTDREAVDAVEAQNRSVKTAGHRGPANTYPVNTGSSSHVTIGLSVRDLLARSGCTWAYYNVGMARSMNSSNNGTVNAMSPWAGL